MTGCRGGNVMANTLRGRRQLEKDRGYSWFVLFMSTISHLLHMGFMFGITGNLTIAHQQHFNINLEVSSIMGSLQIGIAFTFGLVASAMVKKLGCRVTQIFGGCCLILGLGLSSISTEVWHGFMLFSMLTGVGVSSCYTASSQVLHLHFNKYKYLAFATAVFGTGSASVAWPVVSQFLLDKYGYSKAIRIMACAHVVHILSGITYVTPPHSRDPSTTPKDEKSVDKVSRIDSGGSEPGGNEIQDGGTDNLTFEIDEAIETKIGGMEHTEKNDTTNQTSLREEYSILLRKPKIWMMMFNCLLWNVSSAGFKILINDYIVINTEMNAAEAAVGTTILGCASMVGWLAVVATSTLKYDRVALHLVAILWFSVTAIASAFVTSKVMYYGLSACWGFGQSAMLTNIQAFLHDINDGGQQPILFGLAIFLAGLGLTFVPLAAYLSKIAGERYGLIFIGCCGILSCTIILPIVVKRIGKKMRM